MFGAAAGRSGREKLAWILAWLAAAIVLTAAAVPPGKRPPGKAPAAKKPAPAPKPHLQWDRWISVPGIPPLVGATAAYDSDDGDLVVFGGRTPNGSLSNDTWIWDGRDWERLPASRTVAPPPRELASMAFDPYLHQLILFGGQGAGGLLLGDAWAWNGYSWYQIESSGPGPRESAVLTMDPRGDLLLFGGFGYELPQQAGVGAGGSALPSAGEGATLLGDTWIWTSSEWVEPNTAGPSRRASPAAGYDPSTHTTILFGGQASAPGAANAPLADSWSWDGATWKKLSLHGAPRQLASPVLLDDPPAGVVLLIAGLRDGRTGIWELWGTSWVDLGASGLPPARIGELSGYDVGSRTVVFGEGAGPFGDALGDLWQLVVMPTNASQGGSTPTTAPGPVTTVASSATTITSPGQSLSASALGGGGTAGRSGLGGWDMPVLVGAALLIPLCAWFAMVVAGRLRRRRRDAGVASIHDRNRSR
jgi:hypothetical protein